MEKQFPICLQCEKPITRGRPDRKFCSEGCKNLYHNQNKIIESGEIKDILLILKRNRRILKKLFNPSKKEKLIDREVLLKEGFEFNYHTHFVITKTHNNQFIFCLDYGYREVETNKYQVKKSF